MMFYILGAIVAFIVLFSYMQRSQKENDENKVTRIPGLEPSHPTEGNNPDIKRAQHIIAFLRDLHQRFGPIVSFWEGKNYTVSVASPELLKQLRHLKNLSLELLEPFRVFVGDDCMALMNGEEVTRRRKLYDQHFKLKGCKGYTQCFLEVAHEYIDEWKKMSSDDHLPLMKTMLRATMKGILRSSYGDYFKDDNSLNHFQNLFIKITTAIENCPPMQTPEGEAVKKDSEEIRSIVNKILDSRRKAEDFSERDIFIDVLLGNDATDSQCISDSILFIGAGYEVTGKVLTWVMYELASQPNIQRKLQQELRDVLGDEPVSLDKISKLTYLRQIVDETLRLRGQATCVGRLTDKEMKLGDYIIPANTNIYQAIGLVFHDPNIWPHPETFNPDRFSEKNSKGRLPFAFKPFGFAGKRECPGQTYAYIKIMILVAEWCRYYRFKLVPNQNVKVFEGIVVRPEEEIWVTLEPRK